MTRTFATVLAIECSDAHDKVGIVLGRFRTEESNMLTNDFKVGDCISDGNMVGWVYKWHGRLAYTYTSKCTERGMRWLNELSGDDWHRLVPEVILTEKDRVKGFSTLKDGDPVIMVRPSGEVVAVEWSGGGDWCNGYSFYRDPRPLPRIVVAKEKTLEEKVAEIMHNWVLSDASLQTTKIAAEIVALVKGGAT